MSEVMKGDVRRHVPSLGRLLTATFVALVVAAAILVTVVLPAEYNIDPLGTGRALGLGELASATEPAAQPAATPAATTSAGTDRTSIAPVLVPSLTGGAPTVKDVFIPERKGWQFDSREYTLGEAEGMEIKYNMKKGAGLLYSWTASAPLSFEMHGEPDVKPAGKGGTDYYESYELDDKTGKTESHGTFLAPSTGIHGWFWENKTGRKVTLKLTSAGYFDWITENRKDKHTAFKPMESGTLPTHPKVPDEILK